MEEAESKEEMDASGEDYVQRYVDEQAFRFNFRKTNDLMRFIELLCNVNGKRLTYRVLTAQDDAGFMGIP